MQLVPSEGPARPRWGSGPPLSLRVWERKEAPGLGSPSQLAVAVDAGHGTAKSAFPSGRRCRVAHPERERRGAGRPLPASSSEGVFGAWPRPLGPGAPPWRGLWARRAGARAGGGSSQAQAEGAARPRSRPPPGLGRKRGLGRGGAAAPGEAQGSWLTAAPVVAGADLRRPLRLPGKDGPWSVSAPNPRVSVCRCAFHLHTLSALHPHRPQLCSWPLPRVCHLQDPEPPTQPPGKP